MSKGLFVTGTGTDVGKTYVTALIIKKLKEEGLNVGYYKAALSGAEFNNGKLVPGDAEYVRKIARLNNSSNNDVSYVYKNAVSPHLAARFENKQVDMDVIKKDYKALSNVYDYLTVEGSGGIVCPLRYDDKKIIMLEDVIKELNLSVLIVSSAGLGTINATVLTVEYLRSKNIKIEGIILNEFHKGDVMEEDNLYMIEKLTNVKVIGVVENKQKEIDISVNMLTCLYK